MRDLRVVFLGMNSLFTLAPLRAVERRCRLVGIVEAASTRGDDAQSPHLGRFARRRRLPHFVLKRGGPRATQFIQALPSGRHVYGIVQPDPCSRRNFRFLRWARSTFTPRALPKYRGPNPYFWQHHEMDLDGAV